MFKYYMIKNQTNISKFLAEFLPYSSQKADQLSTRGTSKRLVHNVLQFIYVVGNIRSSRNVQSTIVKAFIEKRKVGL